MLGHRRGLWTLAQLCVGAAILLVVVWRFGAGPFLEALHRIDAWSLAAAAGIAVLTTVCCAWRWRLVCRGLGSDLPLRTAVAAYYGSQFLNTVVPGGIAGDLHRGVRRGREIGSVGHGVRGVVWERTAGQVVQVALTLLVLLVLPSPVQSVMPVVAGCVLVASLCVVLLSRTVARALGSGLRVGLTRFWPGIALASVVVVAGHAATFLVAARTAGATVSPVRMLPLALLVLLAMSLPTNVAGWGPREGMAAWAFAMAGLGAEQGVATAVVYGVMVLVATLPGALVLLARRAGPDPRPAPAALEGAARA